MQGKDLLKAFDGIAGEVELQAVKELLEQNDDSMSRAAIVVEVKSVDVNTNQVVNISINNGEYVMVGKNAVDLVLELNNLRSDVRFKVLCGMSNHFISIVNCTGPFRVGAKILLETLAISAEGLTLDLVTKVIVAASRLKITSNYIKMMIQHYQFENGVFNKKLDSTGSAISDFIGVDNNTTTKDIKDGVNEALSLFGNTISITDLTGCMQSPLEIKDEPKITSLYQFPIDAEQFKRENAASYPYGWGRNNDIGEPIATRDQSNINNGETLEYLKNGLNPGFFIPPYPNSFERAQPTSKGSFDGGRQAFRSKFSHIQPKPISHYAIKEEMWLGVSCKSLVKRSDGNSNDEYLVSIYNENISNSLKFNNLSSEVLDRIGNELSLAISSNSNTLSIVPNYGLCLIYNGNGYTIDNLTINPNYPHRVNDLIKLIVDKCLEIIELERSTLINTMLGEDNVKTILSYVQKYIHGCDMLACSRYSAYCVFKTGRDRMNLNTMDTSGSYPYNLNLNIMGSKVLEKKSPLMLTSISGRGKNNLVKEFSNIIRKVLIVDDRNVDSIMVNTPPHNVLGITTDTINNAYVRVRGENVYLEMDGYGGTLSIDISLDYLYSLFIKSGNCNQGIYSKIVRFLITTYSNLSPVYLANLTHEAFESIEKAKGVLGDVIMANNLLLLNEDKTIATSWLSKSVAPNDKVLKRLTIGGHISQHVNRMATSMVNETGIGVAISPVDVRKTHKDMSQASVDESKPNGKLSPMEEMINSITRLHWAMNKHLGNLERVIGEDVCSDVDFINSIASEKDIDFRIIGVGEENIKATCKHMGENLINIYEVPDGFKLDGFFFVGQNLFASYLNKGVPEKSNHEIIKDNRDHFRYVDITATEFNLADRRTVDVRSDSKLLSMYVDIANKLSKACHEMIVRRAKIDLSLPLLAIYQLMDIMDPEVLASLTSLLNSLEEQKDMTMECYKTQPDFKSKANTSIVANTPTKEVRYVGDNEELKEIAANDKGFKNPNTPYTHAINVVKDMINNSSSLEQALHNQTEYRKDVVFNLEYIPDDLKLAIINDELFARSEALVVDGWVWVPDPLDFNSCNTSYEKCLSGEDLTKLCIKIALSLGRLGCRGPKTENRLLSFVVENVDKLGMDNLRIFHDKITSGAYPELNPELVNVISHALSVRHTTSLVDVYSGGMYEGGFFSSNVWKNVACKEILFSFVSPNQIKHANSNVSTSYTINASHLGMVLNILKSDKLFCPKYYESHVYGFRGILSDEIVSVILNSKKVNNAQDYHFLLLHLFNVVKELPLENLKLLVDEYKAIPALTLTLHGVEFQAGNIIRNIEELVEALEIEKGLETYAYVNDLLPMSDEPKEDGMFDITIDIDEFVVFTINNKFKLAIENVDNTLVINDGCNARVLRQLLHKYITALSEMSYYGSNWTVMSKALRPRFLMDYIKHIALADIIAMLGILSSGIRLKNMFRELYNVIKDRYYSLVDTIETSTLSKQPIQVNFIPVDVNVVCMHETEKYLSICFKDKDENHYNINLANGKHFDKKGVSNQKVASEIVAYILSNYGSKILEGKKNYPMMCGMLYRFKDAFFHQYPESTLFHILDSVGDSVELTTGEAKRFIGMLSTEHVAPTLFRDPLNANYDLYVGYKLHRNFRVYINLATIDIVKKIFYTKSRITLITRFIHDIITETIPDVYTFKRLAVLVVGCMWDKNISIEGFTTDMLDILIDHVITAEHDYTMSLITLSNFNLAPNKLEDIRDDIINFN